MQNWFWLEVFSCALLCVTCLQSDARNPSFSGLCEDRQIHDNSGVMTYKPTKAGRTCWNFESKRNLQYFHLRFKDVSLPLNCISSFQGYDDDCGWISVKITYGRLTFGNNDNHSEEWCVSVPDDEIFILSDFLRIEISSCNSGEPRPERTPLQFKLHFNRSETCSGHFPIESYRTINTYKMIDTPNMKCHFTFSQNLDLPLQIKRDYWNKTTKQYLTIYDGTENDNSYVGRWLSPGSHNGPDYFLTDSNSMYVVYEALHKASGVTFTVKVKGYCLAGYQSCGDKLHCYHEDGLCDGVRDCPNSQDEVGCSPFCNEDQVLCGSSEKCVEQYKICDGYPDCDNHEDEKSCLRCNASLALTCDRMIDDKYYGCYMFKDRCNQINDCLDKSDEKGCPPTRKVITASTIGGLICGVLFACALGCSMRLFGLRNANQRRHNLALQQTPIGRMTRRLLQREAPPSYSMAVHGREQEESSRRHRRHQNGDSSSQRRHRRRHRRRRSELRIRRSQPSAADLQQILTPVTITSETMATSSSSNSRHCRRQSCDHLLCNESPLSNDRPPTPTPTPRQIVRQERNNSSTIVDETPPPTTTLPHPPTSMFSFSHGASIVNFPLARICSTRVPSPATTMSQISVQANQLRVIRAVPDIPESAITAALTQVARAHDSSRKDITAPPLPKKRPIKPVFIAAPCDDVTVDQSPACIYPNPPSYKEAVRDVVVSYDGPQSSSPMHDLPPSPSGIWFPASPHQPADSNMIAIQRQMMETAGNEVIRSHQQLMSTNQNHNEDTVIPFHNTTSTSNISPHGHT